MHKEIKTDDVTLDIEEYNIQEVQDKLEKFAKLNDLYFVKNNEELLFIANNNKPAFFLWISPDKDMKNIYFTATNLNLDKKMLISFYIDNIADKKYRLELKKELIENF